MSRKVFDGNISTTRKKLLNFDVSRQSKSSITESSTLENILFWNRMTRKLAMILILLFSINNVQLIASSLGENYFIDGAVESPKELIQVITDVENYHLFSHGKPGHLLLDGEWMDVDQIIKWIGSNQIAHQYTGLKIYGCNFAKGRKGKAAVFCLESVLGVSIAASDDITGVDGDWDLEVGEAISTIANFNYKYNLQCATTGPDKDGDGVPDTFDQDDDNDGILDCSENACPCPNVVLGPELVFNGDFSQGYAGWTSDFNRGRNNNNGPPDTSGGCGSQGWVAISPCSTNNGSCDEYYDYEGGTYDGSILITDSAQTGANVWNDVCNENGGSCNPEPFPDHTQNGDNLSVYIDPSDIAGEAYWQQLISGVESCRTYEFSAWLNVVEDSPELDFRIGGNVIASVSPRGMIGGDSGPDVWQEVTTKFVATSSGNLLLELVNTNAGCSGNDIKLDDVSFREVLCDTDGDGIVNSLDLDSDNDGIPDAVEACGNITVTLENCMLDSDGSETYEVDPVTGCPTGVITGSGCDPLSDIDMDGIPDYLDLDSDGDGCSDAIEAGTNNLGSVNDPGDLDNDTMSDSYDDPAASVDVCGLVIATDASSICQIPASNIYLDDATNGCQVSTCADAIAGTIDLCEMCNTTDGTDQSNPVCFLDCDNGGVDNVTECDAGSDPLSACDDVSGPDKDSDGVPDAYDLDSDNDGILDVIECPSLAVGDKAVPRFVVGHHTTTIIKPDNTMIITGRDTQADGTSNYMTFTEVDPSNGYNYSGDIIDFAIAGLDDPQYILATTGGLYAWGSQGAGAPASWTTGTSFEQIMLPASVSPTDIIAVDASGDARSDNGVIAILTASGEVWVAGDDNASAYGDGSTTIDANWHQVETAPGVPLTGVTELELSVSGGYAVTSGGVYAWGEKSYLGDGNTYSDIVYATMMTLHPDFTSTADIVEIELSIADQEANGYAMLHTNGKLYTVGDNSEGMLGQGDTSAEKIIWGIVQNPSGTGDMENIFFIDGQSHTMRQFVHGFVFLADDPLIDGFSETYFMGRDNLETMTTGVFGNTGLPEIPTYYLPSYMDMTGDGIVDEADYNACVIAMSSHVTVYYDATQNSFAFAGHNADGAFGQTPIVEDMFVVSTVTLDLGLDPCDADGDGIADYLDLDSDNDGIPDAIEACGDIGLTLEDCSLDSNGDATYETDPVTGCSTGIVMGSALCNPSPADTDGDGTPDYLDLDSDGDGCPDAVEAGTDGFGTSNTTDTYVAGTVDDCGLLTTGISGVCPIPGDMDWIDDTANTACDCDYFEDNGLSICDHLTTYPNSNIGTLDCDSGGVDNATECDAGSDPLSVCDDVSGPDKDGDGVPDAYDLDDDNDGIPDLDEGLMEVQTALLAPDDDLNGADRNNIQQGDVFVYRNVLVSADGTNYDVTLTFDVFDLETSGSIPDIVRFNPGNGNLNIRGFDSGQDDYVAFSYVVTEAGSSTNANPAGVPVTIVSATIISRDIDGNEVSGFAGMQTITPGANLIMPGFSVPPGYVVFENNGPNSVNDNNQSHWVTATYLGVNSIQVLYGESAGNSQTDGGRNSSFIFRIAVASDTDGDGIDDYLDLDSDNDGIPDAIEACGDIALTLEDCSLDSNGDATYETDPVTGCSTGVVMGAAPCSPSPADTDGDGTPDYLDLDSDGDGCPDAVEAGTDGSGTSNTTDTYVAGTVDDCGLLTTGISGVCPIPGDMDWIDDTADTACDCDYFEDNGLSICDHLTTYPNSNIGTLDCDGGGVDNATECAEGNDPLDATDDCAAAESAGMDICTYVLANPTSPLALADCDGGGVSNYDECTTGEDPFDPSDDCTSAAELGLDMCPYILANPTSPMALADCDGGGIDNLTECQSGQDPFDPADDCTAAMDEGVDICMYVIANPTSPLALADCDGGGINNITECLTGEDPFDPADDCQSAMDGNIDICPIILANPTSPLALADCDGGGVSNIDECMTGEDPLDPADDCQAAIDGGLDICLFVVTNPTSPLALADCDGGGVSNIDECLTGEDPLDPSDDCTAAIEGMIDICALVLADPTGPLALADCDGGGINNITECMSGEDPSDPSDDCMTAIEEGIDICAIIAADPTSPLANADCDGGGIINSVECDAGDDPADPIDDSQSCMDAMDNGLDICDILAADPDNPIGLLDCDGGGVDNATECANGTDPFDYTDECTAAENAGLDICVIIAANPSSMLAMMDCDGGGIINSTECDAGNDPFDAADDCDSAMDQNVNICNLISADPTHPLAALDCDGGGVSNADECATGEDPFDPSDDCTSAMDLGTDICIYVLANPTSPLALADCDGGGVNNLTECQSGEDPFDPADDCTSAMETGFDVCAFILANPTSPMATADCDGGGVSNVIECMNGEDPLDPADDCQAAEDAGIDICLFVLANPTSPLALADCDGGGVSNLVECQNGEDPFDPSDDCQAAEEAGMDICVYVLANPTSPLALADCDGGGISNLIECQNGQDPFDAVDDCTAAELGGVDICPFVLANPASPLALADCDGGGISNLIECQNGQDPFDAVDDCTAAELGGVDICPFVLANPASPLALADCDGGGISNLIECQNGQDPFDAVDDCTAAELGGVDICPFVLANPASPLALADCDGGGVSNLIECQNGQDPFDAVDDCTAAELGGVDICPFVLANPASPLALADCDGGGVSNLVECQNGQDPFDPVDDCTAAELGGVDICPFVLANPASPLALADCDGGGVSNLVECQNGQDPFDPVDDCTAAELGGVDICPFVLANPASPLALADCDGGGVSNLIECQNGQDPFDPADDCSAADLGGEDICTFILANPTHALATSDCDGGGVSNLVECQNGQDPFDESDDCIAAFLGGVDICNYVLANPTSTLALADCDGGGVSNLIECQSGSDPFETGDDCIAAMASGTDICDFVLANPAHPLALADCDGGGISNLIECQNGENPLDPSDDCQAALDSGMDVCAYVLANPTSTFALADCDGGGVSNLVECQNGQDPLDPVDDCTSAELGGVDLCTFILANPAHPLAQSDCDGGGISNLIECQNGEDPFDPSDDCQAALDSGMDICSFVLANPTSTFAQADCDGGGISNLIECQNGENPLDPSDDCQAALDSGMDVCAYVLANPTSTFALADCDGGGVSNLVECQNGQDPLDPVDDCTSAELGGVDLCTFILANPAHPLAQSDCDGGGISNLIECQNGEDPFDPTDDCQAAVDSGVDICVFVVANPTHPLALADCDGGGISNLIECQNGENPLDPSDDCQAALDSGMDVCAYVLANPTSSFALADCDGGGVSNLVECQNGQDPLDPIDDCQAAILGGADICDFILANPAHPFAQADCDGGGISNLIECQNGEDPLDPSDDCQAAVDSGVDICVFVIANPMHPLAQSDCDGGGISNLIECQNGENPLDPSDDCQAALDSGMDVCTFVLANPTSSFALADCDGGGISNLVECQNGGDPLDASDDCDAGAAAGQDFCSFVLTNPTHPLALADCDGGGVNNVTECLHGEDPFDPSDDCQAAQDDGQNICFYVLANPSSPFAQADCDGGGISNLIECQNGDDPFDPIDDDCDAFETSGTDMCAYILANPTSTIAQADCDGGGISNLIECQNGDDPFDPIDDDCDAFETSGTDMCAYILANPTSTIAQADCDGGGISNLIECQNGDDPFDPIDDDCDAFETSGADMCAYILANPTSTIAQADCDGGGISNLIECQNGDDPFDPIDDDCDAFETSGTDMCAYILANPTSTIAQADCDGGGISNLIECQNGDDPFDPIDDDCDAFETSGTDMCAYILANPTSTIAQADCDGGGISNLIECQNGDDPFDPIDDDCDAFETSGTDMCAYILANPTSTIAQADCDGGGISNLIECQNGGDPFDPIDDDCVAFDNSGTDLCAFVLANPTSTIAQADCDGGGVSNIDECMEGGDPFDPSDDFFDLMLVKQLAAGQSETVEIGDNVTFEFVVTNLTAPLADNIEIQDVIPTGFSFDSFLNPAWSLSSGVATTTLTAAGGQLPTGGLGLNQSATVSIVLTVDRNVPDGTTMTNTGMITSGDDNPTNDTSSQDVVTPITDAGITKTLSPGQSSTINPGDVISYDITVTNNGTSTIGSVYLTDVFPDTYLTLVSSNWLLGQNPGVAVHTAMVNLAPGDSYVVTVMFELSMYTTGMALTNNVDITSLFDESNDPMTDSDPSNDMDSQTVNVLNTVTYDISLDKTVSANTPLPHFYNSIVEFEVTVCNDGNAPISNVQIADMLGNGYQFVASNPSNAGWTNVGGSTYTYNVGMLQIAECQTLSMFCQVLNNGGPWTNTAEVTSATTVNGTDILTGLDISGPANNIDDLQLAPMSPSGVIGSCVFKDLNGNGIKEFNEPGIPGIKVELFNSTGTPVAITSSDNLGNYAFMGLDAGAYYVRFTLAEDYQFTEPNQGNNDNTDSDVDNSNGPGTTAIINLGINEVDMSIYAGLFRCIPFGDLIWLDANNNNRQDADENGVNGVKIDIYRRDNGTYVLHTSTYSGHKPGTPSDDGYWKVCLPPGEYFVKYNVPQSLRPAIPMMGGVELDSNVTGTFGDNTTNSVVLESCTTICNVDAGYQFVTGFISGGELYDLDMLVDLDAQGQINESSNQIAWNLSSDNYEMVSHYEILRSLDGDKFDEIGKVLAQDTQGGDYSFDDYNIMDSGDYTYKVIAFSQEGLELGYDDVSMTIDETVMSVYPNPVSDILNVEIDVARKTDRIAIGLYDTQGRLNEYQQVLDFNVSIGTKKYDLDMSGLNAGVYTLKVDTDGFVTTKKVIVVNR